MGVDWTERSGDINIVNNAGAGTSSVSWMTRNNASDNYVTSVGQVDFGVGLSGPGINFIALTVGDANNSTEQVFAKIQDNNGDGQYDRIFFYKGINGGSWAGGNSSALATPVAAGRIQLTFSQNGDEAILDLDNNFDGTWDEQFRLPGVLAAFSNLGTDFGVSTYQDSVFDNWSLNGGFTAGTPFCFGNSQASGCPCGNFSNVDSGCVNSSTAGAILDGSGDADVAADTYVLSVTQAPASTMGVFFSGSTALLISAPFGDGLRCVGGPYTRLQVVQTDGSGNALSSISLSAREGLLGGELRSYQYWFSDGAGPCGAGFGTSNGFSVQW
jgi:hypothetical protein